MTETKIGKYAYALGRRKTSSATVRLFSSAGESQINGKSVKEFYKSPLFYKKFEVPFVVAGLKPEKFHFTAKTTGGGSVSQIGAIQLGLARAIIKEMPEKRTDLKKEGLLMRDPRMVERKKPGLRKARKAEQYSKR